jgi:hypothetical protein
MESEQLVVMARAMEFQTTPSLILCLSAELSCLLPGCSLCRKYGYNQEIEAESLYSKFLFIFTKHLTGFMSLPRERVILRNLHVLTNF